MSYPSGPPGGYSGQPQQQGGPVFGQPPTQSNPLGRLGVPGLLTALVLVLALVVYFCSFSAGAGLEVMTLLAGGLLAGLNLLPRSPAVLPFATVLSVVGGLTVLASVISNSGGSLPTSTVLILVFGLLQAVASVAALLLDHELIKLAPRTAVPHGGPGYPPSGGFAPHQPPPGQHQPTQYTGPVPPPQQQPQSTQFLQQPGQLSQPANPPHQD